MQSKVLKNVGANWFGHFQRFSIILVVSQGSNVYTLVFQGFEAQFEIWNLSAKCFR